VLAHWSPHFRETRCTNPTLGILRAVSASSYAALIVRRVERGGVANGCQALQRADNDDSTA